MAIFNAEKLQMYVFSPRQIYHRYDQNRNILDLRKNLTQKTSYRLQRECEDGLSENIVKPEESLYLADHGLALSKEIQ